MPRSNSDQLRVSPTLTFCGRREISSTTRAQSSLLDLLDDRNNNKSKADEDHAGSLNIGSVGQTSSGGSSLLSLLEEDESDSSFDGIPDDGHDHSDVDDSSTSFTANNPWGEIDLHQEEQPRKQLPIIGDADDAIDIDDCLRSKMPPLQYQSKANSERLFSSLAPHLHNNSWRHLTNRLTRTVTMINNNIKYFDETLQNQGRGKLKGIVKRMLTKGGVENMTVTPAGREAMLHTVVDDLLSPPKRKRNQSHVQALETHGWMKPLFLDYFYNQLDGVGGSRSKTIPDDVEVPADGVIVMNEDDDASPSSDDVDVKAPYDPLSDPHYPPNVNLANIDRTVDVLTRTREKCLSADPLFWSKTKAISSKRSRQRRRKKQAKNAKKKDESKETNTDDDNEVDGEDPTADLKNSRINLLRAEHEAKDADVLLDEARQMAEILAQRLPPFTHELLIRKLDMYASGTGGFAPPPPPDVDENGKKKRQNQMESNIFLSILRKTTKQHVHLVAADLAKFLYIGIPENIYQNDSASAATEINGTRTAKQVHSFDDRVNGCWVEWDGAKAELAELLMECQHGLAKVENLLRKEVKLRKQILALEIKEEEEKSMAALLKNEMKRKKYLKHLQKSLKRKGRRAVFDAMLLTEKFAPGSEHVDATETDRTIFVDCLPIDTSVEEIREIYSRCGPIQSLRVFNLRPDLDPGPPTPLQRMKLRKKHRRAGGNKLKKDRKRSPIYAKIIFATKEGYEAASRDELRIFGMVIRRHPARSIPAKDATTLYLENVPRGLYALDVETKLSRTLHPDIYIGLDVGQNDYWRPASCEIRFPSFETALHAFAEIEKIDMSSETAPIETDDKIDDNEDFERLPGPQCAIHWMPTTDDASFFYTRVANFDP